MTLQKAIELACKQILPAGFKPEDYFQCDKDTAIFVAKLVVKEAKHILEMSKLKGNP